MDDSKLLHLLSQSGVADVNCITSLEFENFLDTLEEYLNDIVGDEDDMDIDIGRAEENEDEEHGEEQEDKKDDNKKI